MVMKVEIGLPLILVDAEGLEEHGLENGMEGECGNVLQVGEQEVVFFRPYDQKKFFTIDSKRVVVDEEMLEQIGFRK